MVKQRDSFYDNVNSYTKYKLVEMLIDKWKDKSLDNLNVMEALSDDVVDVLALCGMKFFNELNKDFDN